MAAKTNLIAYCGLYCGDCPSYTQEIADLAKALRKELRHHKFGKYADDLAQMPGFEAFKDYEAGYALLGSMMKLRCKGECKAGGGSRSCPIKKCARRHAFEGCWQCDDFETCATLKILEGAGDRTHLKNLRKIQRQGPRQFVKAQSQ